MCVFGCCLGSSTVPCTAYGVMTELGQVVTEQKAQSKQNITVNGPLDDRSIGETACSVM